MEYLAIYINFLGVDKLSCVQTVRNCTLSIPLAPGNTDFDKFCVWNKRNGYPIEIPAEIMALVDEDLLEQIHGSEV